MRPILSVLMFIAFTFPLAAHAAGKESIVAVVNQGVVTASDLNSRVKLVTSSSGLKPTKEMAAKLRTQILNMLIDEEVRLQNAASLGLNVSEKEIDEGFTNIAKQNNLPAEEFKKIIQSHGINIATMRDQIKAQLAWTKIVQKRVRPRVEVSDADIDNELERQKDKIGKDQYLLSQIYIPITQQAKANDAMEFATKLTAQLKTQPDAFPKAAKQFSAAPGADKGGVVGWVMAGQSPDEVDAALPNLVVAQVTGPIKTNTGLYILLLNEKRQLSADKLPSRDDIVERLGMERLDRAAKRYFQDIRSAAFVEKRG